jgi:acyl-coenzyme A thioesterase PaaI-like protein
VTSEFHVKLKRTTPSRAPLRIEARVVESSDDRAVVEAEILSGGKVTSTCRGVFVAVQEGHPAYHRWN